jgi:hypothetical protein
MENKNPQEFLEELYSLCKKYQVEIYMPDLNTEDNYAENSITFNWNEVTSLTANQYYSNMGIREVKEYSFRAEIKPALSLEA